MKPWVVVLTLGMGACSATAVFSGNDLSMEALTQLSDGQDFPCARGADGQVACWGYAQIEEPVPVFDGTYTQVSVGVWEAMAVREDGTLDCQGPSYSPECDFAPASGGFVQGSVYVGASCALDERGDAWCWSDQWEADHIPGPWLHVSAGIQYYCLLAEDRVVCDPPGGEAEGLVQLDVGARHACGLTEDGEARCWWSPIQSDPSHVEPPPDRFVQLSTGCDHACGLKEDGSIVCWGSSEYLDPPAGRFVTVAAGSNYACAVDTEDHIHCWGEPPYGGDISDTPW